MWKVVILGGGVSLTTMRFCQALVPLIMTIVLQIHGNLSLTARHFIMCVCVCVSLSSCLRMFEQLPASSNPALSIGILRFCLCMQLYRSVYLCMFSTFVSLYENINAARNTQTQTYTSSHIRSLVRAACVASEDCMFASKCFPCQHTISICTLWWRHIVQPLPEYTHALFLPLTLEMMVL